MKVEIKLHIVFHDMLVLDDMVQISGRFAFDSVSYINVLPRCLFRAYDDPKVTYDHDTSGVDEKIVAQFYETGFGDNL